VLNLVSVGYNSVQAIPVPIDVFIFIGTGIV